MPRNNRQDNTLYCARCGAENYGFAAFCISCGEPFDRLSDFDLLASDMGDASARLTKPGPKEPSAQEPSDKPIEARGITLRSIASLRERREAIIGILLVALVLGYQLLQTVAGVANLYLYRTLPVPVPGAPYNAVLLVVIAVAFVMALLPGSQRATATSPGVS